MLDARRLAAPGRLVRSARRVVLHIDPTWPWADTITTAHTRLCALTVPSPQTHPTPATRTRSTGRSR